MSQLIIYVDLCKLAHEPLTVGQFCWQKWFCHEKLHDYAVFECDTATEMKMADGNVK